MRTRSSWTRLAYAGLGIFGGLLLAATPGGAQGWDQAYGNLANTGFVNTTTHIPVSPRWIFQLDGSVSAGGPSVNGKDGTIWVGTANGTLWGFQQDGSVRCSRSFKESTITSTPAFFKNGDLAILFSQAVSGSTGKQTSLARVTSACTVVWQVQLPQGRPTLPSTATGSVKIWTRNGVPFLFVHARQTINVDLTTADPESFHELLVYDEAGKIFARRQTGNWCITVSGGGGFLSANAAGDPIYGDIWNFLTFWPPLDVASPLYRAFGWPDSTPAIMDSTIRGYSTPLRPLVAVTDHNCAVSLDVFQFDPDSAPEDRLLKTWGTEVESRGTLLSSPTVTPEGLVVFGTSGHRVRMYDLLSRSLRWSYDTTYPVMHPPALAPDAWIVPSDRLVHLLKPVTGGLLGTARPQPFPILGSLAGLAASLNEVVVPNFDELGIWSHDLVSLTHARTNDVFRTSTPALTPEGRLYVVGQTIEKSWLMAFGPP